MINYIPFLKFKSNEIIAVGELEPDVFKEIIPFFDYPKSKDGQTPDQFKNSVMRLSRSILKHIGKDAEFYFDNFDLEHDFSVNGKHNYYYLLESLSDFNIIPVVCTNRNNDHIQAVYDMKEEVEITSDVIAFRITPEDFKSYKVIEEEITEVLGDVFELFDSIDLIFDCRLCKNLDPTKVADEISRFSILISEDYKIHRLIITGSSIPASVSDILPVHTECTVGRNEINIFRAVRKKAEDLIFTFGDYATVSPYYSDINIMPEMMQNITTAKLTYTIKDMHYFIRGGSLRAHGAGQYFKLAAHLCAKNFFRGAGYSTGDDYFESKSNRQGKNCAPNTIIKPSVNAHITYVIKDGIS